MVFVPMAQTPPKADAKYLLYSLQIYSLNLIHEFTSVFSINLLYVGLPVGKPSHVALRCGPY